MHRSRYYISILAPARGATYVHEGGYVLYNISIHAPAWGATCGNAITGFGSIFQFSPPRGGRQRESYSLCVGRKFQFSPPRGGQHNTDNIVDLQRRFQFSPPRGGRRPCGAKSTANTVYFNSRPRAGGDAAAPTGLRRDPRSRPRSVHSPEVRPAAGSSPPGSGGRSGSAPHPRRNQVSDAGSSSQQIGAKALSWKPTRTPAGSASMWITAS